MATRLLHLLFVLGVLCPNALLARQQPSNVVFHESFDGTKLAGHILNAPAFPSGRHGTISAAQPFLLQGIEMPASSTSAVLTFYSRFDPASRFGIGEVEISRDGGASWRLLCAVDGDAAWQPIRKNLSGYAGDAIALRFRSTSAGTDPPVTWDIDEIAITEETLQSESLQNGGLLAQMVSLNASLFPLIFMNVTVDTNGGPLPTLQQADFAVYENGVLQTDLFQVTPPGAAGGSRLADIVFIMDNSGSLGDEQQQVRDNMVAFIDSMAAAGVDFALGLCRYGASQNGGNPIIEDNGQLTTDTTYFKNDVWNRNVISGFFEPGYYAIVQSASLFNFRPGAQRIFIIITDETARQGSNATQQDAINICLSNSIRVYSLIRQFYVSQHSDLAVVSQQTNGKAFVITDPFNSILNDIQGAVSNTYLVRYRTDHPALDGVERTVNVVATHNAETDTATGTYTPGASPVIKRDSATVALSNQAWPQSTPFAITAIVKDAAQPFTQRVTLYYKNTNAANYTAMAMTKTVSGTISGGKLPTLFAVGDSSVWQATIPAGAVSAPGVDYYLTATDGISTTSAPKTNPRGAPYQIAVLPNKPPSITHVPPATFSPGVDLDITATVIDTTNSLASVDLHYRSVGQILFTRVPMANIAGDTYKATIPGASLTPHGIEYFIRAEDNFGVATVKSFSIIPTAPTGSVVLVTPNGGESWLMCSSQLISWTVSNVTEVNIEYSVDGGTSWSSIADHFPAGNGAIIWDLPDVNSTTSLIRIADASNPVLSDNSDAFFAITDFPQFANWQTFHACNTSLPENYIRAIAAACDGSVWLGTRRAGLLRYENQSWTQYTTSNSGLPGNSILALALQNEALWIGTSGQGLARLDAAGWHIFNTGNYLPHNRVWAVVFDKRRNIMWIGTSDGLVRYDGNSWTVFKDNLPNSTIYAIAISPQGTLWLGTAGGLTEFNDGQVINHYSFANSGLLDDAILCVGVDNGGRVWAGTAKGLNRFNGRNWASFTTDNSDLPANPVRAIQIDNAGNKWIGTWGGGLAQLGQGWTVYRSGTSGLLDNYLISLFIDCHGYKWMGTENGGFAMFSGDPSLPVSVESGGARSSVPMVFRLDQNYPNPFNPTTTITFALPEAALAKLRVYDISGKLVATLVDGPQRAGEHSIAFTAGELPSGVYVYRLETGAFKQAKKLLLVK